jgi:hypothetical protein
LLNLPLCTIVLAAHLAKIKRCKIKQRSGDDEANMSEDRAVHPQIGNKQANGDESVFSCSCGKGFNHKNNMYRHQKTCRHKRDVLISTSDTSNVVDHQDELQDLRNEVTHLREQVHTLSNITPVASSTTMTNNTITINNNNVQINAFGSEDDQGITQHILDQCLRKTSVGLVDLVHKIHFENVHNQNVRASLEHPAHIIECHDGFGWKYDQKKEVLQRIVDNGHRMMSEHFDDHNDRLKNGMSHALFDYICEWLRKMEKSNHKLYSEVMEKVFILILNQSREFSFEK